MQPWATYFLVAINTLFLIAANASVGTPGDQLVELGALHPVLVWKGEIWRLLTAMFVHGSFLHYAFNTFVLLHVGRLLEPTMGGLRLILLYFIAGISGFSLSLLVTSQISLGSSGAVFGLIGALMATILALPKAKVEPTLLRTLVLFVGLNLLFGTLANALLPEMVRMDNAAHIGGLAFGFLFGFGFVAENSMMQRYATTALVIGLLGFTAVLSAAINPVFLVEYHEAMAFDGLKRGDLESSIAETKWLESSSKNHSATKIMYSRLAANQGQVELARELAQQALQVWPEKNPESFLKTAILRSAKFGSSSDPLFADEKGNAVLCQVVIDAGARDSEILNNCSWLILTSRVEGVHDAKKGLELALRAVGAEDKASAAVLHTLAEGFSQNGKLAEAIHAIDRAMIQSNGTFLGELSERKRYLEAEYASVQHRRSLQQARE